MSSQDEWDFLLASGAKSDIPHAIHSVLGFFHFNDKTMQTGKDRDSAKPTDVFRLTTQRTQRAVRQPARWTGAAARRLSLMGDIFTATPI